MKLSELIASLEQHPEAGLAFVLPDGSQAPAHFHVTEVGRVRKDFIDCGGTVRQTDACVLQVWVANDVDHRLQAGKLGTIIALAKEIFQDTDLPVEIEYDVGVITQFAVENMAADDKQVTMTLAGKHTACLAPELCKVDGEPTGSSDAGCCSPSPTVSLGISQGKCC
ncbi:MAG: DUF6428 family protein [Phycisphaeraceae bacterium]